MRSYLFAPSPDFDRPRTAEARIDRLAATLPAADAAALRAEFASERLAAGSAREAYDRVDQVKTLPRAEPFDLSALRAAMADARAARLALDQVLQGVIAAIIPKMSPEGRGPLAEWRPPYHPVANCPQ